MNLEIKHELLEMLEEDNRVREELIAKGDLFKGYHPEMEAVHQRNAQALENIINQHGWPGISLVGEEGTNAAWLILQHAIGNPGLQRKCLPLLKKSASSADIPAAFVAYLEDRICVFENRPQRYGTQFDWDKNGELSPCQLQDPENVDIYRESVGLGPLSNSIDHKRKQAATEGESPPPDFEKRQREKEDWAKSAGWL